MVCPNMRACHIYVRDKSSAERDRVVERLLTEPRIDQVLWRDGAWDNGSPVGEVDPDKDTFHIATAHAGRLRFRQAHDDAEIKARDTYDNGWTWDGDLSCIDARVSPEGVLISNEYPNALERIAHGFCRHADDLWVTARVGHEFEVSETSIHEGGSHGALNKDDSTAPLIAAGVPEGVTVPKIPRTIDLAPLCLQMLGLTTEAERLLTTRHAGRPH